MRSPAALATFFLVLGLAANAAHAQRGGPARGGFAGRAASASGGSFPGVRGPGTLHPGEGIPQYARPFGTRTPFLASPLAFPSRYPRTGYPNGFSQMRPLYTPRPRPPYVYARGGGGFGAVGAGYGVGYPFLDSCLSGCDTSSADPLATYADSATWTGQAGADPQTGAPDSSVYGIQAANGQRGQPVYSDQPSYSDQQMYAGQPAYPAQQSYPDQAGYPGQPAGAPVPMVLAPVARLQAAPAQEEAITILFKDGRPPLQIRNYILTRSALYLAGEHFNEIPLVDIDLPATQRVNWNAGVTFRLP